GQMTLAQEGVAVALDVQAGPAKPSGQEHEQLLLGHGQIRRMHGADGACLGQDVHETVEAGDEGAQRGLAAELFVGCHCLSWAFATARILARCLRSGKDSTARSPPPSRSSRSRRPSWLRITRSMIARP